MEDRILSEERIEPHALYHAFWSDGVCDLRIIVLRGRPILSMVRVPTHRSGGRANLHQGGIGVAVDLREGITYRALSRGEEVTIHPESGEPLIGRQLPEWATCVKVALGAASAVPLGYLGVDICVDRRWGGPFGIPTRRIGDGFCSEQVTKFGSNSPRNCCAHFGHC